MPHATQPLIETRALRRTFTLARGSVEAVAGIDLTMERGTITGLLGPNGAGKTTLLRMLVTLLRPTSGSATIGGFDLSREAGQVRKRVGYVAQGGSSDPGLTGRSELTFQARSFGMSRAAARERAASLLDRFELREAADRPTGTWSGGQRRRLDIALALAHRPDMLVLDEPTTGLDPQSRSRLWDEVRQLRADGATVALTTHYLEEADALCDRLAIIDHGRLVAEGTPSELKKRISGDVVSVGITGDATRALALLRSQPFVRSAAEETGQLRLYVDHGETALPAILRLLDGAGLPPEWLNMARPSLDDVFLQQTGRSLRDAAA